MTNEFNNTRPTQNVCVFCGSGKGTNPIYAETARQLGQFLAEAKLGLVYGGGGLGLMGEIARSVLEHRGRVTGIIPGFLSKQEQMLHEAQELIITRDMHERKMLMFKKSDAFVALPGGIGTLEELVEQLTWSQLGRHNKPVILASIDGFWEPLLGLLSQMREETFIRQDLEVQFHVVNSAEEIVPTLMSTGLRRISPTGSESFIEAKF